MFKLMRIKNLNNLNKFKNFNFKKKFIWIFILRVCNQFIKCEQIQTEDKNLETPNILFIMSDDMPKKISIYGSRLEISPTPNIDRIEMRELYLIMFLQQILFVLLEHLY